MSTKTFLIASLALCVAREARASSHAEAPGVAGDPTLDNTDLLAWQDGAATITVIAAFNGFGDPGAGPVYQRWAAKDQGLYEIHIDTNGDAIEDVTYQVQFTDLDNGAKTVF